jgi:hypothetical protein
MEDRDKIVASTAEEIRRVLRSCTKISRNLAALGYDEDAQELVDLRERLSVYGVAKFDIKTKKPKQANRRHPLTSVFLEAWTDVFPDNPVLSPKDFVSLAKMLPHLTARYPKAGKALLTQAMRHYKASTASWVVTPRAAWQFAYHLSNDVFIHNPEHGQKKAGAMVDLTAGSTGAAKEKATVPGMHGVTFGDGIPGLDYLEE